MLSLYDLMRDQSLGQEHVSGDSMAVLHQRAVKGDRESREAFRKSSLNLGILIMEEEAQIHHLDASRLLRLIDADKLDKYVFRKYHSTSLNSSGPDGVVRNYIRNIIEKACCVSLNNRYSIREDYENPVPHCLRSRFFGAACSRSYSAGHCSGGTHEYCGIFFKGWFRRMKMIIRDMDQIHFLNKLHFLAFLYHTDNDDRLLYYYHFGVMDGKLKKPGETAAHFEIETDAVEKCLEFVLETRYSFAPLDHVGIYESYLILSLTHFLCTNRQTRKEKKVCQAALRRRWYKHLISFLD